MSIPLILPEVQAAILAGGQSRRMGKPKLFLDFRGNTFIAHLLTQLQHQVNDVMIAGAPDPRQLTDLGVPVLADAEPDNGPLGGIATALAQARRQWLLIAPCDNPLLPDNYAARLLKVAREQQAPLVYVRKAGRAQPLYAIVQRDLLASLKDYLASGERKVLPWYESVGAIALEWDDAGLSFTNLNTPEEYSAFLAATQEN
ncbi:MAG TPA: molybdenum cofactor guanylyltransferase MobA [Pseudomonadales bacterium]|nr:molybdenum cofactor guanylyltransferase MobA [Pseudomonadales bacterium]